MTGYVGHGDLRNLLAAAVREGQSTTEAAKPFVDVVQRWNTSFYWWHSLTYDQDETPHEHLSDGIALNQTPIDLAEEFDMYLPQITYIEFAPYAPVNDLSRSKNSSFEYNNGHPLQLSFPHMWPDCVDFL